MKTFHVFFDTIQQLTITANEMDSMKCTKFLGVYSDETLYWNTHIDDLINKLAIKC